MGVWGIGGMILRGGNRNTLRKFSPNATLSPANPMQTGQSKTHADSGRPASLCCCHTMARLKVALTIALFGNMSQRTQL